jgi:hypothetical protein
VGDAVDMLGLAVICWAIWKTRNKTCFDKIKLKSPNEFFTLLVYLCDIGQGWRVANVGTGDGSRPVWA